MKKVLRILALSLLILVGLSACQWIDGQKDSEQIDSVRTEQSSKKPTQDVTSEQDTKTKVDYNALITVWRASMVQSSLSIKNTH